jgi:hypothetical protein
MSAPVVMEQTAITVENTQPGHLGLRICCWLVALALGAAQAWATRFTMNPDGVSYLDIGDAYWRGDWHNAINAYWSPLYSWILGFFLKVLKPSIYWEYPLVHLVNFLIYVGALACFEFFLRAWIEDRKRSGAVTRTVTKLGERGWWTLGYAIFVSCSLVLIGLGAVTPDMCVAAVVYLASALLLRIKRSRVGRMELVALGAVLGIGYLAKTVMLPMGFVFLAAAFFPPLSLLQLRRVLFPLLIFLVICAPFVIALSLASGHATFGDSGRLTYETYVDGIDQFVSVNPLPEHPVHNILSNPPTYEFVSPIGGTYPLWYDPTYWHKGIHPWLNLRGERNVFLGAIFIQVVVLCSIFQQLNFTAGLLVAYVAAPHPRVCLKEAARSWRLLLTVTAAFLLYSVVYTETRYLAAYFAILWMVGFSGIRLPASVSSRRLVSGIVVIVTLSTIIPVLRSITGLRPPIPEYATAAALIRDRGIRSGDAIAVMAKEPFGEGGAFVARLVRARVSAQTIAASSARVATEDPVDDRAVQAFASAGMKAILADFEIPASKSCFQRLANTRYSLCLVQKKK